jgi:hypothetical protein
MNGLLPDQIRVLSQVVSSNEILISLSLQVGREKVSEWLSLCESLVTRHATSLQGKHFSLGLDLASEGSSPVQLQHLLGATSDTGGVVMLDVQGRWITTGPGPVTVSGALARTKKAKGLEILVHGTYLYIALSGELIYEHDVLDASKLPPAGIAFFRPTKQLRELIFDHAGQEIARETGVKYWADKDNRILLAVPESTEKIFQRSLLLWLRHYVLDKIRIYSESRGFGQDATDITVMTGHGDYVIEVKWMGKNEHGTTYDANRIAEGVEQVKIYLNNDGRLVGGAVVLYDGRPLDRCTQQFDSSILHPLCQSPHIVWLESQTPSQKATTIVRSRQTLPVRSVGSRTKMKRKK